MDGSSGKILTMDSLKNRYICIVEWCCMCKVSGNLQIICLFIVIMHRVMVFGVLFVRSLLGYASTRCGFAGLLDGGVWEISLGGCVGGCSSMY